MHEAIFGAALSAEEPGRLMAHGSTCPDSRAERRARVREPLEVFNTDGAAQEIGVRVPLSSWPLRTVDGSAVDLALRAGTHRRNETITKVEAAVMLRVRSC